MSVIGQGIFIATFTGNNGTGACSIPGLMVGDRVLQTTVEFTAGHPGYQPPGAFFELIVSVADELQQIDSSNVSTSACVAIVLRHV